MMKTTQPSAYSWRPILLGTVIGAIVSTGLIIATISYMLFGITGARYIPGAPRPANSVQEMAQPASETQEANASHLSADVTTAEASEEAPLATEALVATEDQPASA